MTNLEDLKIIGKCKIFSVLQDKQNKCMDVEGGSKQNNAKIILFPDNGQANQNFIIRRYDQNYYVLQAEHSNLVLDICGGKPVNGSKLIQYPFHNGDNQLFGFLPIDNDTFHIVSKMSLKKALDIKGNDIILEDFNHSASQKFRLKFLSADTSVHQRIMNPGNTLNHKDILPNTEI